MKISIRAAAIKDSPVLVPLLSELGFTGNTETVASRLQFLLNDPSRLNAVAVGDNMTVVGFLSAESRFFIQSGPFCELIALVIAPNARRKGIARALVEHAEQWAADRDLPALRVRSSVARPEPHPFYNALDFSLLKTQHCYVKVCKG